MRSGDCVCVSECGNLLLCVFYSQILPPGVVPL